MWPAGPDAEVGSRRRDRLRASPLEYRNDGIVWLLARLGPRELHRRSTATRASRPCACDPHQRPAPQTTTTKPARSLRPPAGRLRARLPSVGLLLIYYFEESSHRATISRGPLWLRPSGRAMKPVRVRPISGGFSKRRMNPETERGRVRVGCLRRGVEASHSIEIRPLRRFEAGKEHTIPSGSVPV